MTSTKYPTTIDEYIFTHTSGPSPWVYDPKSPPRQSASQSTFPKSSRPEIFPSVPDFTHPPPVASPAPSVPTYPKPLHHRPEIPSLDDRTILSVAAAAQAENQTRKSKPAVAFPKQRRPDLFKAEISRAQALPGPNQYSFNPIHTKAVVPVFDRANRGLNATTLTTTPTPLTTTLLPHKPISSTGAAVGTYNPILPPNKVSHARPKLHIQSATLEATRNLVNSAILPGPGSYAPFKASTVVTEARGVAMAGKTPPFRLPHPYAYNAQSLKPRRAQSTVVSKLDEIHNVNVVVSVVEDVNEEFDHPEATPLWVKVDQWLKQDKTTPQTIKEDKKKSKQRIYGADLSFKDELNKTLTEIEEARVGRSVETMLKESGEILAKKAVSRAKIDGLDDEKTNEMIHVLKEVVKEVQ